MKLTIVAAAAAVAALGSIGVYGIDPSTTAGLVWGYAGGLFNGNTVAASTVALTDNATNFIVVLRSTGAVSASTNSTNSLSPLYAKLFKVTTLTGIVTAVVDQRLDTNGLLLSAGAGPIPPDTDGTLAANSDAIVSSQKAVKTYVDAHVTPPLVPDTDGTLAANSDAYVPSQKAVKTYVDAHVAPPVTVDTDGTLAANSDAVVASQKAVKSYVDNQTVVKNTDGTLAANSDAYVPSQKAVVTYVAEQLLGGALDTDPTLAANSDSRAASQKATKTYVDAKVATAIGGMAYQGAWNASTNSPALASGAGTKGYYYTVSVAGATALDGHATWNVGDKAAFNGTAWEKFDGTDSEVLSVAGRTGAVVLSATDIAGLGTAATLPVDTDGTLAANSDTRIPSQKAVASYVAAHGGNNAAAYNNATAFTVFGDSISVNSSTSGASDAAHSYPNLVAAARGWAQTNTAVAGNGVADVADAVFAAVIGDGSQSTLAIGTNDGTTYGTDVNKQAAFASGHLALAAWLAIQDSRKLKGQSAGISYTGTWANLGAYGGALAKYAQVPGGTATFTVYGTTAYIWTAVQQTNGATFALTVDGVSTGATYSCQSLGNVNVTTGNGRAYVPQLIRLTGLSEGLHTIVLTVTAASGGAAVFLIGAAGNLGNHTKDGPNLWVGNILRRTATGYSGTAMTEALTAAMNATVRANLLTLAADGLNVGLVDNASRFDPATMTDSGGLHPNDAGHAALAAGFLDALNQIARPGLGASSGTGLNGASSSAGPSGTAGRLTLTSGVPVPTADVIGATTLYWTPYKGNQVQLWDGANWTTYTSAEITLALGAMTAALPYDVFMYQSAGVPTLEKLAWTNGTTRATDVTLQDGRYCKSGDKTRLYLGTFYTTSTTTTEDSGGGTTSQVGGKRFLWNYYNRVTRFANVIDTSSAWTYTANAVRQANGNAGNKVEFVVGISEDAIYADVLANVAVSLNSSYAAKVGIGSNSISAFSGIVGEAFCNAAAAVFLGTSGRVNTVPAAGYWYLAWLESGADTNSSFKGNNSGDGSQSGLTAQITG